MSPFAFYPHRWLANCVQHREKVGEGGGGGVQSVSLSLPVNNLSTASPMQCLLVAEGVTGCREAPILNLQGRFLYNPTVDQAEEEETPNGCESG